MGETSDKDFPSIHGSSFGFDGNPLIPEKVKVLQQYYGYPHAPKDIQALLDVIDELAGLALVNEKALELAIFNADFTDPLGREVLAEAVKHNEANPNAIRGMRESYKQHFLLLASLTEEELAEADQEYRDAAMIDRDGGRVGF